MQNYKSFDYINSDEKISIQKYVCIRNEDVHNHDFIEIEYVFEGSGHQQINGVSYPVERGDLLFLNFSDSHSIHPSQNLGIINCIFNPDFFSKELVNSENALDILALTSFKDFDRSVEKSLPKIKFLGRDLIELEALLDLMKNEFDEKLPGYVAVLEGYTKILLIKIFRTAKKGDTINVYSHMSKITPEVISYIEQNYSRKISLTELAKQSFYNPAYFSRIFKEFYGKSVVEYINERRIESAISLIESTNHTVESICYQVGFNDKKQFFKLFKAATGMTPEVFRQSIKK